MPETADKCTMHWSKSKGNWIILGNRRSKRRGFWSGFVFLRSGGIRRQTLHTYFYYVMVRVKHFVIKGLRKLRGTFQIGDNLPLYPQPHCRVHPLKDTESNSFRQNTTSWLYNIEYPLLGIFWRKKVDRMFRVSS